MFTAVSLVGRVTKDVELQTSTGGTKYVQFSLAVNKGYGEQQHPNFYQCSLFGEAAERMVKAKVKKGSLLNVIGDLDVTDLKDHRGRKLLSLVDYGFEICPFVPVKPDATAEDLQTQIDALKNLAEQSNIPIDGMVLRFDSFSYSAAQGRTGHHYNDGLAFKFEDDTFETIFRGIEWQTGRTGEIAPVALLDTVEIDGCEVSRASLHNLSFIKDLELYPGCRVLVSKRNMIIPHVEDNLDEPYQCSHWCYSHFCPIRNRELSKKRGNVYYDLKTTRIRQDGTLFDGEKIVSITRGIRYFEHPVSMDICEAFVKLQSGRIYEDYKLNHHHLWFMDKTFEAEILNVRAESKPSRDLMQDLQDIQSGIEIRYDADLRKASKEQKSKKRAEAKAKRIQALERKLLEIGYENLESYSLDKVHADKWLEPERIQELTELREKHIEEEKNKPVQLSLSLEALMP